MAEVKDFFVRDLAFPVASWTSEWLNSTSCNTLNIIIYSNKNFTTTVQYATTDDFFVIDQEISSNPSGSKEININPKTRFVRLIISDLTPPTHLEVQSFFYPTNILSKIINSSGNPVSVDSNLQKTGYGSLNIESYIPKRQYIFNRGTDGDMSTFIAPYGDLRGADSNINGLVNFNNGVISLEGLGSISETQILTGSSFNYHSGQSTMCRFTSAFYQGPKNIGFEGQTIQCAGMGNTDIAGTSISDFVGFGYGDPSLPYDSSNFGIIYYNNGVKTFIHRNDWNLNKADGTKDSLNINDFENLNAFEISFQYLGQGSIFFSIENMCCGEFVRVHALNFVGTTPSSRFNDPTLGLLFCQEVDTLFSQPIGTDDSIKSASYGLFLAGNTLIPHDRGGALSIKPSTLAEENILSMRVDDLFYGSKNNNSIVVDLITASTDGNRSAVICLWKGMPLIAPVFVNQQPNLFPFSKDTVGVINRTGVEKLIFAFSLSRRSQSNFDLSNLLTSFEPGEVLTITASSSAVTEISVGISYRII